MSCFTLLELNSLLATLPWQTGVFFYFAFSENVLLVYIKGKGIIWTIVILKFIHA